MTHPVKPADAQSARRIDYRRACVTVERRKGDLVVVVGKIGVTQTDALIAAVPDYLRVVDTNGKTIPPSRGKRFFVSTETFDPFHFVVEMPEDFR